jgi:hypothetical protein
MYKGTDFLDFVFFVTVWAYATGGQPAHAAEWNDVPAGVREGV